LPGYDRQWLRHLSHINCAGGYRSARAPRWTERRKVFDTPPTGKGLHRNAYKTENRRKTCMHPEKWKFSNAIRRKNKFSDDFAFFLDDI
jgi:hypothetical protein